MILQLDNIYAERIGGKNFGKDTTIYKFEKIKRAKKAAQKANPDIEILDLGVGEPDSTADDLVIKKLIEESGKHENRGYSDNGIQEFKDAASEYMDKVFGVNNIDPLTEVVHSIGSKPALAMLPLTIINPGDVALMTTPGYPVF
ncbi:MAG: aminotransferase class I/II-fold pyridoxal phosphate-dependent enzyme, partial [Spirochaetes bacterium]|nr:aminotransferase class I/II-fold pyridoxal phosphate-dependent enzyme [Spirochaetota bacterium]